MKIFLALFLIFSFSWAENELIDKDIAKAFLTPAQLKVYEENLNLLKQSKEKKLTIFYLTSTPYFVGVRSFNSLIDRLNKRGLEVIGFIVLRGFPKDKEMIDFLMNSYQKNIPGTIRVHPIIFNTFKVKRVPAFALSYCPTGENFAFKECENKFLATGDITLTDFFRMISDQDKNYEKYYFELVKAK